MESGEPTLLHTTVTYLTTILAALTAARVKGINPWSKDSLVLYICCLVSGSLLVRIIYLNESTDKLVRVDAP